MFNKKKIKKLEKQLLFIERQHQEMLEQFNRNWEAFEQRLWKIEPVVEDCSKFQKNIKSCSVCGILSAKYLTVSADTHTCLEHGKMFNK